MFRDRMGRQLNLSEVWKKGFNRAGHIWLDFVLLILWIVSYIPFHFVRRLFFQMAGVKMGRGSIIHMGCRFYQPKRVEIGEGTIIGDHAFLDGRAKLKIGSHTAIASQVLIYNSEHDVHSLDFKPIEEPVEIGDYVFIGARAVILPGVKIGRGAVIAAGAVVTKDVGEMEVVGGVPAKIITTRRLKKLVYRLGRARLFQ